MVFPIAGGTQDTGYEIDNSVRVGFGHELSRTFTEVTAERKKHTMSCWVKRGNLGDENHLIYAVTGSDSTYIRFDGNDTLRFRFYASGADQAQLRTNRLFRDPSAWYHVVLVYDSAQGTASNRVKIYINGVQETSFSTEDYPDQNEEAIIGHNAAHSIEGQSSAGDFYVADWYFIGNQALAPTDFGETNDNGVWVPKKYTGSFGSTNDTFLQFKQTGTSTDASGIGADTSGEGNHMAVTNLTSVDVTIDTPTNNFCTLNPLDTNSNHTFSEGNCKIVYSASAGTFGVTKATMGVAKGKWYWEVKYTYGNAGQFGVFDVNDTLSNTSDIYTEAGNSTFEGLGWRIDSSNNIKEVGEGQQADTNVDFSSGNILGIAFDADNGKIYAYNNGTELTSQDISAGTSLITALTVSDFFLPFISNGDGGSGTKTGTSEINFGNPTFSISSGNSDANGYGNFEYAVPSGYYALCTKNLAEYG